MMRAVLADNKFDKSPIFYRARWVVPAIGSPIRDGVLEVCDGTVRAVRPWVVGDRNIIDLGDQVILPGLINAHTHLEFSDLLQPVGLSGTGFADWIGEVVAARLAQRSVETMEPTIVDGANEMRRTGTILCGEISTTPWPGSHLELPLDVVAFAEVLGLSEERAGERFKKAIQHCQTLASQDGSGHLKQGAISPHAPYSLGQPMLRMCLQWASNANVRVAMHVAESPDEMELLQAGTGPLASRLAAMGLDVAAHFPIGEADPIAGVIDSLASCRRALLVHGNQLRANHLDQLSKHPNVTVVMCPRTHHFFQFARHPVAELLQAGVNVALGTDSRASNPDLNLWGEVQHLLRHRPDLSPASVIAMATLNGAVALGDDALPKDRLVGQPWRQLNTMPTSAQTLDGLFDEMADRDVVPVAMG